MEKRVDLGGGGLGRLGREQRRRPPGLLQEESRLLDLGPCYHPAVDHPGPVLLGSQLRRRRHPARHGGTILECGLLLLWWQERGGRKKKREKAAVENHFHPV